MMDGLFLLLGSNVGGSITHIETAKLQLLAILGDPIKSSSLYKTAPWGNQNQEWFINQVLVYSPPETPPEELLEAFKRIERNIGRQERVKWGPREIDIDILYWEEVVLQTEVLQIPHPAIPERRFTLVPLVEVEPEKLHPVLNKTQAALLEICPDTSEVKLINPSDG